MTYLRRCYRRLRIRLLRNRTRARLERMKREWQRREMAGRV